VPSFHFEDVLAHLPFLMEGVIVTAQVSVVAMVVAGLLGSTVAALRVYGGPLVGVPLGFAVDSLRAIPQVALLVWIFYALPVLMNQAVSPFVAGVISLGVQYAAFMSEVVRAGLGSLSPGQEAAALAIGMTRTQAMRRVLIPQAVIRMLPPAGSLLVALLKDSSLLFGIGVLELMNRAATLNGLYLRPFETFTIAGLIYLLMTYPITVAVNWAHGRLAPLIAG
jgi:polar amino acid transport system permease protein